MTPNFNKIVSTVIEKSPLQKKKIEKFLSHCDGEFFAAAEKFAEDYIGYLESQGISVNYAVDAYLKLCDDMMKSQIYFMRTGKYPSENQHEALENVYENEDKMKPYMVGLALSQFLWSSHYQMYSFFKKNIKEKRNRLSSYFEIGPGHGLFLREAIGSLKSDVEFLAVDISRSSIEMTKSIMRYFYGNDFSKISYHQTDMLDVELRKKFDFITMGEVLEHVNYPTKLLRKLRELLQAEGEAFVSTCVNAPAVDHVYHFKSVDEIREMIAASGLTIMDEKVLPVEDLPMKDIIERKITINYCAMVRRDE
jgi:2-polyprenyl-3-methyl-5-hydroxy-6-metoxy-1,4-benzoquinol methylase